MHNIDTIITDKVDFSKAYSNAKINTIPRVTNTIPDNIPTKNKADKSLFLKKIMEIILSINITIKNKSAIGIISIKPISYPIFIMKSVDKGITKIQISKYKIEEIISFFIFFDVIYR